MRTPSANRLKLAGLAAALSPCIIVLAGCHSDRSAVAPLEPTWTYHDGPEQLSNNDLWERMIPEPTFFADAGQTHVARAEDSTD